MEMWRFHHWDFLLETLETWGGITAFIQKFKIKFLKIIWYWIVHHIDFPYLSQLYLILHKLLEVSLGDQSFYLLFQGTTFFSVMTVVMVKVTKFIRLPCIYATLIKHWYQHKIYFLNCNQHLYMCSSERCGHELNNNEEIYYLKIRCLYLVTFISSTLI